MGISRVVPIARKTPDYNKSRRSKTAMETSLPILNINDILHDADHFCLLDIGAGGLALMEQLHRPNFFSMLLLYHGTAKLYSEGKHLNLLPYQVVMNRPLVVNSLQIASESKGYLLCFTESFFSLRYNSNVLHQFSFYQAQQTVTFFQIPEREQYKWRTLLTFMLQEQMPAIPRRNALRSYLNILLQEAEILQGGNRTKTDAPPHKEKVMQFIQLVDQHYIRHKNPSYYAEKLHISQSYLNRLCKAQQALTSGQIIKQRVLLEAKRLLLHTPQSISEIAYTLGFESPSYFNTFFKKGVGAAPERYRKKES
ncbi:MULTISPECIES: helix-turn-helix domain-containing protein [Sphingobacterium]|uniref:Helix-turn-helix domain-containing protein n=1 Tax=Sphingobacterium populi TaxID=1812824 RepID=A0ABW5UD02_9SPHI|nr:AraC family transcriptional regulator [Sphingobacterium sp. CFCC 11742]